MPRTILLALAGIVAPTATAPGQQPAAHPGEPSSNQRIVVPGGAAASQFVPDDLAEGRRLLEGVHDNVFSFDDPAFYWYCRHIQQESDVSRFVIGPEESPTPWQYLLERPSDYRGRLVVAEGLLQAVHGYEVSNRPGIGKLYQCELSDAGTRAFCTVVVVQAPGDIPLHSRVRAKGYFIKVRAFQTTGGDTGAGPLLVARTMQLERAPTGSLWSSGTEGERPSAWWNLRSASVWLVPGTAGLAVVWLMLRRSLRTGKSGSPSRDSPEEEEDFEWLTKNGRDQDGGRNDT